MKIFGREIGRRDVGEGIPLPEGDTAARKAIGEAELRHANELLRKYKEGKATLEQKIIENEEYWRLRQWRVRGAESGEWSPATAWLWSCIESRLADAMDSFPTCNARPRAADDVDEAEMLTSVLPVLLEHNDFEETYAETSRYALIHGTVAYGVFWDSSALGGLGDVAVRPVDLLNLFWEPGVTDIQKSSNVFHVELVDNKVLESRYPELVGTLGKSTLKVARYVYDDHVDTTDKSVVVDWYYHTEYGGKRQLQYCKFVGEHVLYASENDVEVPISEMLDPVTGEAVSVPASESMRDRGYYDHGKYPFIIEPLYPVAGTICGYGLTDIGRDVQDEIDSLNRAITKNAVVSATPRYFYNNGCGINLEEYRDLSNDFILAEGLLDELHLRRVEAEHLGGEYSNILTAKIEELKHITSSQDVMNGAAPAGVTTASGIAALQETAGKKARATNKTFHRAYREVIYMVIELIRQFYDVPRQFRITGGEVAPVDKFVEYSNANLKGVPMMGSDGRVIGARMPEFDIEVTSEKANPYKKIENNELALQFYNLGFFNPQMGDQVISCLRMMDFEQKDDVLAMVGQNATLFKMLTQYQSIALGLAEKYEPQTAEMLSQAILEQGGQMVTQAIGGDVSLDASGGEHPFVENARRSARASTEAE